MERRKDYRLDMSHTKNVWTEEDKALLYTDMSTEEIAEKTGRTYAAIQRMRYDLTGHYVEKDKQHDKQVRPFSRYATQAMSDIEKEARILHLAKDLNIKLEGSNDN